MLVVLLLRPEAWLFSFQQSSECHKMLRSHKLQYSTEGAEMSGRLNVSKTVPSVSLQPPKVLLFFDQTLNWIMHRVPEKGLLDGFLHDLRFDCTKETAAHAIWGSSFKFMKTDIVHNTWNDNQDHTEEALLWGEVMLWYFVFLQLPLREKAQTGRVAQSFPTSTQS